MTIICSSHCLHQPHSKKMASALWFAVTRPPSFLYFCVTFFVFFGWYWHPFFFFCPWYLWWSHKVYKGNPGFFLSLGPYLFHSTFQQRHYYTLFPFLTWQVSQRFVYAVAKAPTCFSMTHFGAIFCSNAFLKCLHSSYSGQKWAKGHKLAPKPPPFGFMFLFLAPLFCTSQTLYLQLHHAGLFKRCHHFPRHSTKTLQTRKSVLHPHYLVTFGLLKGCPCKKTRIAQGLSKSTIVNHSILLVNTFISSQKRTSWEDTVLVHYFAVYKNGKIAGQDSLGLWRLFTSSRRVENQVACVFLGHLQTWEVFFPSAITLFGLSLCVGL